ncbi:MAG: hypothetical protein Kow0069_00770 [Promethearchaeota archaeon]
MKYDLIVVGGGPGGATAAKFAAKGGATTLVLEAAPKGRYKCCAGGVPITHEQFSPPEPLVFFEHEHFSACSREERSCAQPTDARTNHDDVPRVQN